MKAHAGTWFFYNREKDWKFPPDGYLIFPLNPGLVNYGIGSTDSGKLIIHDGLIDKTSACYTPPFIRNFIFEDGLYIAFSHKFGFL